MRASFRERPPWLVRVGEVGAGVLIAPDLVLTCDHVVPTDTVTATLVHHGWSGAANVVFRAPVAADESGDIAVLRLSSPVPDAVVAPLRAPAALADHPYVVQGFAQGRHAEARGRLGGRITPGWVQMNGAEGHVVDRGFSGAPVWDSVAEAVVGIVVMAQKSVRAGALLPVEEVVRLWPDAAAHVGWRVDPDDTHWLPRARGVEPHDPTDEWHFVGRHRALHDLATYLSGPGDGRVRAVIGSPGSGKSAVVARTVVLADRAARHLVPADSLSPDVALPPPGSVTVAVHARGKTLSQVVQAIADGAEVEATDPVELVRRCGPVSVVVDALDEATGDAPLAIATMLHRLATNPTRHVIVGTRVGARNSPTNLLLTRLGNAVVLDLDSPTYLDPADLLHYAQRRVGNRPLAERIARQANGNFLIAQLTTLTAMSGGTSLATTVGAAVDDYLSVRFDDPGKIRELLLPLAFAEGTGLPEGDLWLSLANALSAATYTARDLREALTSAASYLVEQSGRHYRLFHQALDDTFRAEHPGPAPDQVVYETLRAQAEPLATAPQYIRTNLPAHAATAGRLDELVEDLDFMLTVSPECMVHLLPEVTTDRARAIRNVYRRALHGLDGDKPHRSAHFALVARQLGFAELADEITGPTPWQAEVVTWRADDEQQVILRLPTSPKVRLWFDAQGNPAALVAPGAEGGIELYRYEGYRMVLKGSVELPVEGPPQLILQQLTPDGHEVGLTAHWPNALHRWSISNGVHRTGGTVLSGDVDRGSFRADTCTADGRLLAVLADDDWLCVVDWTDDEPKVLHESYGEQDVFSVAITAHGGRVLIALATYDDEVALFAYRDGAMVPVGSPLSVRADLLRFTTLADATCLLMADPVGRVLRVVVTERGFADSAAADSTGASVDDLAVAALPGGRTLVAVYRVDNTLAVYDATDGLVPIGPPRTANHSVVGEMCIGTGPWGTPLVLAQGHDDRVRLWEAEHTSSRSEQPPRSFDLYPQDVARFGKTLLVLSTSWLRKVEVWALGDRLRRVAAEEVEPRSLAALSHEEPLLVTLHAGSLKVFDIGESDLRLRTSTGDALVRRPVDLAVSTDVSGGVVVGVLSRYRELRRLRYDGSAWSFGREPADVGSDSRLLPYRLGGQARFLLVGHRPDIRRPGLRSVDLGIEADVSAADLGYAGDVPVAALADGRAVHLVALAEDRPRPWAGPIAADTPANAVVAVAFPQVDQALVAVTTRSGVVRVWVCREGQSARQVATIEPGAVVHRMVWTDDRRLVVFCGAGVLRFSGF
ncbi:S1 family peptidase [Saccharothrix variisporea]|uniref:S1 family peptidase n=1 Tax=Saccharothrix variisporea TaxID=543527 RepID=UPI001476C60A|nr:serine protease [Saccharothrix variisporea]